MKSQTMHTLSGASLALALMTFLAMWGGVTLLLTDAQGLSLPPASSTPRGALASLLLFWMPVATGLAACTTGLIGLAGKEREQCVQRRAMVGTLVGLVPVCLATAWLAWVLSGLAGQ